MAKTQALTFKRTLNAPPAEVYRAFTNATALREWLCNTAQTDAHKGGRLYLWWNSGYYACGEFTAAEPGKKIAFTWRGQGEPEATRVQVTLTAKNSGTVVTLKHAGVGSGKKWAKAIAAFQGGWEYGLENLQSVLETGYDLRIMRRPMFGIAGAEEMNAEIAAQLGVPVKTGLRLDGVLEGMGAQVAGLQKDDVLVSLAGKKITGFAPFVAALQSRQAGDKVPVIFYRGAEKRTVTLELSRRPLPEVPPTAGELAEAVRKLYAEMDAEVARCFEGVSEAAAGHRPAPAEWSAKETLGHLITTERDTQSWVGSLILSAEAETDFSSNVTPRVRATVAAFPTVPALLDELKRMEAETVALLAALPPEFVARKTSYIRLGQNVLQTLHVRDHLDQIGTAIAAARKK